MAPDDNPGEDSEDGEPDHARGDHRDRLIKRNGRPIEFTKHWGVRYTIAQIRRLVAVPEPAGPFESQSPRMARDHPAEKSAWSSLPIGGRVCCSCPRSEPVRCAIRLQPNLQTPRAIRRERQTTSRESHRR